MNEKIACAYEIASKAHEGQLDKGGHPYLEHPIAVANIACEIYDADYSNDNAHNSNEGDNIFSRDDLIIVALLHDTLEDAELTVEELSNEFEISIVDAIESLTRRSGEPYMEYVARAKDNPIARLVKIADLKHNSDLNRVPSPTHDDKERIELKYKPALEFLNE